MLLIACGLCTPVWAANPDGDLRIEIASAYNFVVDSNVESPSTYAPRSAYLSATFHNDGANALTNVWAYIGDYTNGTPGTYPSRTQAPYNGPLPGDAFALTHEGGTAGAADASRYLGTILPGESITVYWLVSYPNVDEDGNTVTGGIKPDDDLWLQYDVWGTAMDAGAPREAAETRTVTMRNEISAMANKIFPNGANKVPQEYLDALAMYEPSWTNTADDGSPGTVIATEGVWYDLGNVGAGFDNNGDLVPDRNAWLQPVGDANLFDSSCFRLVHTYALVIVKLNDGTEQIYNVEDQLYFENVPGDNRGAVGYVRYEFMAMRPGCSSTLTPYQEVASGYDNEKFNGDYGAFLGQGLTSQDAHLDVAKSVDKPFAQPGEILSYTIAYTNPGPVTIGDPDGGAPLVMREHIPHGTLYVGLSSGASNSLPSGVSSYTILYSTNNGASWQETEPADPTTITDVQWWLSDPLATNVAGSVKLQVTVTTNAGPLITNQACATIAGGAEMACDETTTSVLGTNRLGDLVWRDDGTGGGVLGNQMQDGTETAISNVTVWLYYDANTNGLYDAGDLLYNTTSTATNGYYMFTNLPDGKFVAAVDARDPDLPTGYSPTTATNIAADLDSARTNSATVSFLAADFGFAPALTLIKTQTSTNAVREGLNVTYNLTVSNNLPGNGGGGTYVTSYAWATNGLAGDTEWLGYTNVYRPPGPDGLYTSNRFNAASKTFGLTNFPLSSSNGTITNVTVVMPIIGASAASLSQDGELEVHVHRLAPAAEIYTTIYRATNTFTNLTLKTWEIPMTGTFAWAWADFATNYTVELLARKNAGGAGTGYLQIDAVGFRITSVSTGGTGSASTTLYPVPLTDQYDADKFQFISAYPPQTSSTTNGSTPNTTGTLYWANLGPIYPGGTSTVAVTFKLLKPETYTNLPATNVTWVTNATFQNGVPANMATSSVVVTQAPAAKVGDYVWRDLNADGIQNETNMGIANVAVSITPPAGIDLGNGAGAAITNFTDAYGYYSFESIPATGVYTVRVVTATLPGGSGVNTYDERGAYDGTAAIYLDVFSAPSSTNNVHLTTDFGYQTGTTIEGTIWHDYDRGMETNREAGEDWLTNVTVYLCASPSPCGPGASIATNTTTTNGYFRFVGAYTGSYTVMVATNTGMMTNSTWNLSWDTNGTNTPNYVGVTVVTGGVARADFSYWRTGNFAIGDTLYVDWDGNGMQSNAWEEGITNVTVYLYEDANGNGVVDLATDAFVASTVTASNGYYVFTNLFATNTYLVYVDLADPDLPASYLITGDPYGAKDARSVATITNANNDLQDFGFQPYGSGAIGDTVWKDWNADGSQSGAQETGISNVLVILYVDMNKDNNYVLLRTTNTSATGTYLFGSLPDGNYRVVVDAGDADLPQDAFGNFYYPSTATTNDVTISDGNTYLDADFGFAPYGAIGDTVFWDANRNGTQDYSESGVSGVVVRLFYDANTNGIYDPGETLAASATTDVDGLYLFAGLLPTNYAVQVVTTNGPLFGTAQMADPNSDGYACDDTNNVVPCDDQYGLYLNNGQNFMGADFGYAPPGVIGDYLWVDTDNDGVQDAGESGIPYVSVVLYSNGVAIATNETDADGYYYFSNLPDGTYGVRVATNDTDFPAGLTNTWAADGTFDNDATNIVISGGSVASVGGYPCTDCDLSIDFGYRYSGNNSLSGTIGFDATPYDGVLNGTNASGVAANEAAYAGVSVYLYLWNDDGDGIVESGEYVSIASTATASNGDYSFTGLPNGDGNDKYVVASAAPEDYLKLTTTNGSIAGVGVVETTNASGNTVSAYLTIDVAPVINGMDFAYRSTKNYDYGDLPANYETLLPNGARHVVTTSNLYLGATVDVENNGLPSAGADGDDLAGADDEDGVAMVTSAMWHDGATGGTVRVTVGAGSGWLVGYIDFNNDGDLLDPGEMVCSLAVSNTGGNGAGVYTNKFDVPYGTFSTANSTSLYARFRLFPDEPFLPELAFSGTADNGEVEDYLWHLSAIGDYVWIDSDGDGAQDAGEPALAGVRVFIDLNADGLYQTNEPSATTGDDGLYGIGGLVPGTYTVAVDTNTLPSGVSQTYDFDGTGTANKASITVNSLGEFVTVADFGYRGDATVGDRAWFDADRDGLQDPSETNGIANLPVALLDADSNVVATTTTDANGYYLFGNVPAGTYLIRFDLRIVNTNVSVTLPDQGGDDSMDSDATSGGTGGYAYVAAFAASAGTTNLTIDLGLRTTSTTRAEVAEVWGEASDAGGKVVWKTSSEWNTAGFIVYRVDPETDAETRLNDVLAPSAFSEAGTTYELVDPEAVAGAAGTYRLEEVELTGGTLDLGTHAVAFSAVRPRPKAAKATLAKAALATPKLAGPSPILKVTVRDEGLYAVALQAVADGMGIALEDAAALAQANELKLTEQGAAVPVLYDEAKARLVFYGRGADDWYARDNAYFIERGAGLVMPRREPGAATGGTVLPASVNFEVDKYPFDGAAIMPEDFYYWEYVLSGTNAAATKTFPLDLSGAVGDVALKVRLVGWSSTTNDPDHLAEFKFNGAAAGSIAFDGQDAAVAELEIPAGAVLNGLNTLAVKGTLQSGRAFSYFVVDGIAASFARTVAPASGTAIFQAGGAEAVSAVAFAEPVAVALDEAGTPMWLADAGGALPAKAWAAAEGDVRYAVAEAAAIPELAPEAVAANPWFLAETNRVDYLVLTSRALEPAAKALADYRAGQGLRVGVATFEDVCDWMAGGLRTPEAIPELLAYAMAHWTEAPWLMVLAGNGHYDYLGALSNEVNHMPPLLLQTADGLFASDNLLADADGDRLPDVAVGRLPARTTNELAAMVAKIKAYEAEFGSVWQNQLVLATDTNDAAAGSFKASNARFAALATAQHPVAATIDLNAMGIAAARASLSNAFKGGAGFIHYTGHGGVANWSKLNLLKAADVAVMANARQPVVVALSCLVGRYEAPGVDSLGELLMRRAGGGAAAVWGPSGLSRNDPASDLGAAFYRAILREGAGTLGLAVLQARRSLSSDVFTRDTLDAYNLLGDPAQRLAGNLAGQASDATFAQWRWQRFAPAELAVAEVSGATDENFFEYALDGGVPVEAELPEFGYPPPVVNESLPRTGEEGGFILRWKRRVRRADVEYLLFVSENLQQWTLEPGDVQTIGVEADPDGVMETVRTRVNRPWAERVYIGVKARKK